ncbi:hypothetical protein GobsT_44320 [Gemmata obscuriglobus]|nr:hypothetical protein GobsT_44320 [Gemmata obscuriglobus]VTS08949.1 unnamed protein product [Gemmata obscuriglobus UQM 2246]
MAVSGAAPGSASARAVAVPRSPRSYRASAEPPPTRTTVSRPTGGRPTPHLAAMSRADHPPAPRGAPPTRTTVSPPTPGHDHPHLAAVSRAHPDRHHAEPDARGLPPRTTCPPPHARSCTRWLPNEQLTCTARPDERCVPSQPAVSGAAPGSALPPTRSWTNRTPRTSHPTLLQPPHRTTQRTSAAPTGTHSDRRCMVAVGYGARCCTPSLIGCTRPR